MASPNPISLSGRWAFSGGAEGLASIASLDCLQVDSMQAEDDDEDWSFTSGLVQTLQALKCELKVVCIDTPQDTEQQGAKDKNRRIFGRILPKVLCSTQPAEETLANTFGAKVWSQRAVGGLKGLIILY